MTSSSHLPNQAAPTPGITHIHLNTEPTEYTIAEPQPQTIPNTTTMEVHHSTPSDTDDMMQENPATTQGRGFDPHSEPTIQKPENERLQTGNPTQDQQNKNGDRNMQKQLHQK